MPTAAIALFPVSVAWAQSPRPPFRARGEVVEAHRSALQGRIHVLRATIRDSLTAGAPDLIATLDPAAPPVRQGYRLLPRVVADSPQPDANSYVITTYSWAWTDSLIDQGGRRIESLAQALAEPKQRPDYERLVADFNALVAHRRLIDSHVEHNWQWQQAIANDPARFGGVTRAIDSIVGNRTSAKAPQPAMPRFTIGIDSANDTTTLRIPVITDIDDTAFVRTFRTTVESQWRVVAGARVHRVVADIRFVAPRDLYCAQVTTPCNAPAEGATLDMPAHIGRFPTGTAILTTGATQTQVIGGRALVLGPRAIAPRTLAHEFGHLLGFDDAYLRGQRDLGAGGFAIVELVPNRRDVMASPGFGGVLPRHFDQLENNVSADAAMRAGLAAMYERRDAARAVRYFRDALAHRPGHYGATFQLAKSLDKTGDSTAATIVWKRMLDMAIAQNDQATVKTVRSRLGIP